MGYPQYHGKDEGATALMIQVHTETGKSMHCIADKIYLVGPESSLNVPSLVARGYLISKLSSCRLVCIPP